MNDNKKVKKLYESIRKVDYFELDEKDFNFDEFIKIDDGFFNYVGVDVYSYLLEDFEELESDNKAKDCYLITLHNGLKFNLLVRYFSSNDAKELVEIKSGRDKEIPQDFTDMTVGKLRKRICIFNATEKNLIKDNEK